MSTADFLFAVILYSAVIFVIARCCAINRISSDQESE
jgi:hypothetical protein